MTRIKSDYDLRVISHDSFFSEEQRSNIHVIGASRQGKSFFLEWLMRGDIDKGLGCCLLDPSAGGSTAYRLLAYCAEKQKQNVLFIDTEHYHNTKKVIGLNPFLYKDGQATSRLKEVSVRTLMGAVRDLYGVKDPAEQSRIERYLPKVFEALYDARRPLTDARIFTNRLYRREQDEILSHTSSDVRTDLREALTPGTSYINFQSTINRLLRFAGGTIGKMFSSLGGVDWMKVVREHWAVIVRLDNLDTFDARLLGTYIIAQLQSAKERLNKAIDRHREFSKVGEYPPFYLYADEAYLFASESLKNVLDLKQKMNFKVTLAHHYAKQFSPDFYESLKVNTGMTVQFYIKGRDTRDDISSELYGGDINPKDASYANSNLSKQHAVIKIGKGAPKRERLPDVPTPQITKEDFDGFIINMYQHLTELGWYKEPIFTNYEPRSEERTHQAPPEPRAKTDSKAGGKNRVPDADEFSSQFKDVSFDVSGSEQHAPKDGGAKRNKGVGSKKRKQS